MRIVAIDDQKDRIDKTTSTINIGETSLLTFCRLESRQHD